MIDTPPEPPPAQEQVIEQRLLDCGLKAGGFTVRYEDYLDGIEVVITPLAGATPDHFDCIRGSIYPEFVRFEDYAMYEQYMAYEADLVRPQVLAEVEAALKERDLWDGFPDRAAFASMGDYVRALEKHAGIAPGSALRVEGDRLIFDPPRVDEGYAVAATQYSVILMVMVYAAAKERLNLGFIGNDKFRE
ncbi:MAG: hypothetical protein C0471_17185 [Erythrobacter sp.]|nr:hypothetical protein [Erythrobacter sp.]